MSLGRYVLRRILVAIPVLFGVSVLTFSFIHLLPGDAIDTVVGFQPVSPEAREALRAEYHLDDPLWYQYIRWLGDVLTFTLGESAVTDRAVGPTIGARIAPTVLLGAGAWLMAIAIGIPAGILAAYRRGTTTDEASRLVALAGVATPNFWLGLLLLIVFAVEVGWFRVIPPDAPLVSWPMLSFMVLPTITLGTASAGLLMRLMRRSMIRELERDYVRTARAKGLPERTIVLKHALRNSLVAVVTVVGVQLAFLIDGAVVVEAVFSWPGMGRLLLRSIASRDIAVVQAIVLLIACSVVLANLLVDIAYAVIDPRVRYRQ